jgi:lactate permease
MSLFLSVLPLALLIFLMVSPWPTRRMPLPATQALPAMALLAYLLQWTYFRAGHPPGTDSDQAAGPSVAAWIHAAVVDGSLSALTPLAIVFGAVLLFKTLEHSGAMAVLTGWLRRLTPDPVAQCMLIGWAFSYMVEGLSGFGTPAALAAPVLLGLLGGQYAPVRIAALCLIMNSTPVSFGAVGTPTWFGMGALGLTPETLGEVGRTSSIIHAVGAPVIALLALRVLMPWSIIRPRLGFVLAVVAATMVPSVIVAQWSSEFPSIVGGAVALVVAAILARLGWGLPRATGNDEELAGGAETSAPWTQVLRAAFPILAVIALLAITRIDDLGIKSLLNLEQPRVTLPMGLLGEWWLSSSLVVGLQGILGTTIAWKAPLLYVPCLIPFVVVCLVSVFVLGMNAGQVKRSWTESFQRLAAPAVAMAGALVLVKLMMLGNLLSPAMILGRTLGESTGQAWPWFAALLGTLGAFFSGSNTVSNLTFAPIQQAIAESQGLSVALILALQSVGGAMGNMVCIHNIVAVAAILGLGEKRSLSAENQPPAEPEGVAAVLRLTFPPMMAYAVVAAVTAAVLRWVG